MYHHMQLPIWLHGNTKEFDTVAGLDVFFVDFDVLQRYSNG